MSPRSLAAALALALLLPAVPPLAQPADAQQSTKASICHRTRSMTNPYRRISVAQGSLKGSGGHAGHTGGVWDGVSATWGDIIPDTTNATMNWSSAGIAIWNGTTKAAGGIAACRYQSAKEFYEVMKAAGATDDEIVADLNAQGANEDAALRQALGGSFTTANLDQLSLVSATTGSATEVHGTGATLAGSINLVADTAAMSFRYGLSPDLSAGTATAVATPATATGPTTAAEVRATVGGLLAGTTYYYRVVGTTAAGTESEGTIEGEIRAFTTPGTVPQAIDFPQPGDVLLADGPVTLSASADSGLPVTLVSGSPAVCRVDGHVVTPLTAGTCVVAATQPGDATYAAAAPVHRSFSVSAPRLPQTLALPDLPDRTLLEGPLRVQATASSGLPVALTSLAEAVCTVAGDRIDLVAPGTCTLAADQPGDAAHLPAERILGSFQVAKAPQAITFPQPADARLGEGPVPLAVSASSGLGVVLLPSTPGVCGVAGLAVTLLDTGTCTITALQEGDGVHAAAAPVSRSFAVQPAAPVPLPDLGTPEAPTDPGTPEAPTDPGTPEAPTDPEPDPTTPRPAPARPTPPPAPRGAVESGSAVSETPQGSARTGAGPLASDARGTGALTVARLGAAPPEAAPGAAEDGYYLVAVSPDSTFHRVELRLAGTMAGALYWHAPEGWRKLEGTTRDPATGDLVAVVTATTRPGLADLADLRVAAGTTPVLRLAGPDRTRTAVEVSRAAYPEQGSARAAVLARDDLYADALTGGPLAAAEAAPLLLSDRAHLPAAVAAELRRAVSPGGTVFLLGGEAALSAEVAAAVRGLGFGVERVAGRDRFATAVQIAGRLGHPDVVFLASGLTFPDAISAGPAAISAGGAVLLTAGAAEAAATSGYLATRTGTRYAVGGPAASAHPEATPLQGSDRFATSARVAERFFDAPDQVGLAAGTDFPDSIVAAPYLGRDERPLLLTAGGDAVPAPVEGYLTPRSSRIQQILVFGGSQAVGAELVRAAQRALP